jgi:hypothetical protein
MPTPHLGGETVGHITFITVILAGFVYAMAAAGAQAGDAGDGLRYAAPTALALPFVVICAFGLWTDSAPRPHLPVRLSVTCFGFALVMLGVSFAHRADQRSAFLDAKARSIVELQNRLEQLRRPGTRVAFWDDPFESSLGEPSFHFTGNYEYGGDRFDSWLLESYPDYTLIRLPEVVEAARNLDPAERAAFERRKQAPRGSSAGRLGILWRRVFPHPYPSRKDEVFVGEKSGARVSAIALPSSELEGGLEGITPPLFWRLVETRMGTPTVWTEEIAGTNWVLASIAQSPGVKSLTP